MNRLLTEAVQIRQKIPLLFNPEAGSAKEIVDLFSAGSTEQSYKDLCYKDLFDLTEARPNQIGEIANGLIKNGARRVAIAGGDGSIAAAAAALAGTDAELAVIPGGTLNHFAKAKGIPTDLREALSVAVFGKPLRVDVAYVGDTLFLNTSSVGAYISFVRVRERLEKNFSYAVASLISAFKILFKLYGIRVVLELKGHVREYKTPLVFMQVVKEGLQVRIARWRMDRLLVKKCTLHLKRDRASVSVDGEIITIDSPLEYRFVAGGLTVIVPDSE